MNAYLNGHERLPFQERILPILILRPLTHSQWITQHLVHANGMYTAERGPFYVISLCGLLLAGIFVQRLYNRVTRSGTLSFLVYPIFLFAIMWSYSIHNEANFSYPYDILSVAFFTAGLYYIYMKQFLPLVFIMVLGTLNRETTLFLIGIYLLDAASTSYSEATRTLRKRFSWSQVSWARVGLLVFLWLGIKLLLAHVFAHNDNSENYIRISENFGRLKPRLWPALLNICGYMLPVVFVLRRDLRPRRFANYLYIFPLWFVVMFYTGVIVETRVYGELCSFVAIAIVLIMEYRIEHLRQRVPARVADPGIPYGRLADMEQ